MRSMPALARHLGERARCLSLALLEVGVAPTAHGVDQVVGDIDALARALQRWRVEDVALVELGAELGQVLSPAPVSHETANARTVGQQPAGEPAADEPGGSCDECARFTQNANKR